MMKYILIIITLNILIQSCGDTVTNENTLDSEVPSNVTTGEELLPDSSGNGFFEIQSGTISFIIHATSSTSSTPNFISLRDPNKNDYSEFYYGTNGYSGIFVPYSPNYPLKSGIWSYRILNYNELKIKKRTNPLSNLSSIKVQPYISGSDNISLALNIMKNIYSTNGINLDVEDTETLESKYSQVSSNFNNSTTSEMVSQGDEDKVNLFFITDYTDAGYLGNAAGIPGSQGLKGSHNGVLINLNAHKTGGSLNDQLLGETAAHEMGHFLGLWHPTEGYDFKNYGLDYDPILDTPECPESKNTFNDVDLTANECGKEYGADNLMFWSTWANGNQDNLTEGQVYVLKRALIAK